MPALAKLIPIGMYMDHGESVEIARPNVAYTDLAGASRRILKAGDKIPLKGVDVEVVISGGQAITKPAGRRGRKEPDMRGLQAASR